MESITPIDISTKAEDQRVKTAVAMYKKELSKRDSSKKDLKAKYTALETVHTTKQQKIVLLHKQYQFHNWLFLPCDIIQILFHAFIF